MVVVINSELYNKMLCEDAIASQRIEGLEPSPEFCDDLMEYSQNRMDFDTLEKRIFERHGITA
jgi:Antitoxin VbhA